MLTNGVRAILSSCSWVSMWGVMEILGHQGVVERELDGAATVIVAGEGDRHGEQRALALLEQHVVVYPVDRVPIEGARREREPDQHVAVHPGELALVPRRRSD